MRNLGLTPNLLFYFNCWDASFDGFRAAELHHKKISLVFLLGHEALFNFVEHDRYLTKLQLFSFQFSGQDNGNIVVGG